MPSLTVRAIAEMLRLPAYQQARILVAQKHPREEPQVFRTPYYQPVLTGMRNYFRFGNDERQLDAAARRIESLGQEAKRVNNARVLRAFEESEFSNRRLTLRPNSRVYASLGDVELKLSPDLRAVEEGEEKIFFINCRAVKLDDNVARSTLEIAHWVLEENGIRMRIGDIEYIDLFARVAHATRSRRSGTIRDLASNVQIIEALWPTL